LFIGDHFEKKRRGLGGARRRCEECCREGGGTFLSVGVLDGEGSPLASLGAVAILAGVGSVVVEAQVRAWDGKVMVAAFPDLSDRPFGHVTVHTFDGASGMKSVGVCFKLLGAVAAEA